MNEEKKSTELNLQNNVANNNPSNEEIENANLDSENNN